MKVHELLKRLAGFDPNTEIMVADHDYVPRTINIGPYLRVVTDNDAEECGDCEGLEGSTVVLIGFGSY